jgi:hypothetical protein
MVDNYQMVLGTVQTVSLVVGIFYYVMTLRNSRKAQQTAEETRKTQFFMQLYNNSANEEGILLALSEKDWEGFDDWWEKYGIANNPRVFARWFQAMYTYEMYGLMVKRGLIDVRFVDDLMSGGILSMWEKYGPIIKEMRERFSYPQLQEHQEYLAIEIRKIVEQQHPDYKGALMK